MEWFYCGLGGIDQTESSVGYKNIVIKPEMAGNITCSKTSYECPYGEIRCNWDKQPDIVSINIKIPVNTPSMVFIPVKPESIVAASGIAVSKVNDIKIISDKNGWLLCQAGSGNYFFTVR